MAVSSGFPLEEPGIQRYPAVDDDRGARDVAGLVAGCPDNRGGDLVGLSHTPERNLLLKGTGGVRIVEDEPIDRRDDGARGDIDYSDVQGRELPGRGLHEQSQAAL